MADFIRSQAIVLRRTNYGEADRILSLITPAGQFSAIAKGVLKSKSKLAGGVEMLSLSDLVLVHGRGEMKTVTSARLVQFFDKILTDYDRLSFAYLVLKQVERASREIDGAMWFEIVKDVLSALDQPEVDFDLIQAWFYLRLSSELGETLNLVSDANGAPLSVDAAYNYDYENRCLRMARLGKINSDHVKLMRLLLSSSLSIALRVKDVAAVSGAVLQVARAHAALN